MRNLAGSVALTAVMAVSAAVAAESVLPTAQSVSWPGVRTVWQHDSIFMASAPNREGLAHAKSQGVTTVINLMLPDEDPVAFWPEDSQETKPWFAYALEFFQKVTKPWNEADAAMELGLRYEQIPISVSDPDPAQIRRFLDIMHEVQARQVLIHCEASGRALAMWAVYLGTAGGLTPEQAIASAGLEDEGLKKLVLNFLQQKPV
jgi:protein tyrosine phosphatase (PTP) superfamily phosphohydrolase (DUF442 family)